MDTSQKGGTKNTGDEQEKKKDPSVAENQGKEIINDVPRSDKNQFKVEKSNTELKSDIDQPKDKNKDGFRSVRDKDVEKIESNFKKSTSQHREQDEIDKGAKNDMKLCEKDVRQGQTTCNSRREKDLPWQHNKNDHSRENRDRYQFQMKRRNQSKEDYPGKRRRRNKSPDSVDKPEEMGKDFSGTKKQSDFQRGNDYRSICSDSKVSEGHKGDQIELPEKVTNQTNQRGKHLRNGQDRPSFRLGRTEESFSSPMKMGQFDKGEKLSVNASGLNRSNMSSMHRRTNFWEGGGNSQNYEDMEMAKGKRETSHFSNIGVTSLQQLEDKRLMQSRQKGILGAYVPPSGLLLNKEHNVGTSMHLGRRDVAHQTNSLQRTGRKRPSQMAKNEVPKKLQAFQLQASTEFQSFSTPNVGSIKQSDYFFDNLSIKDYTGANKEEIANNLAFALTKKGMTDIPDHRLVSFLQELGYMNQNNRVSNAMSHTSVEMNADDLPFYRNTSHWQKNFVSPNNQDTSAISQRKETFSELGITSLSDSTKQHFGRRTQTRFNPESNSIIELRQLSSTPRESGDVYRMPTFKIQTRKQQNSRQNQKQPKQQKRGVQQKGQNIKASQCENPESSKSLENISYSKTNEEQFVKGNFEIAREMLPLQFGKCQDSQTRTLFKHSQRKRRSKKMSKGNRKSSKTSGSPEESTERKTSVTSTNNELYAAERNQNLRVLEEKLPSQFGKNQSGQRNLSHKQTQQTKMLQNYPQDKLNQNPQSLGLSKTFKDSEMTTSGAVTVDGGQFARLGAQKSRFSESTLPSSFGGSQNVQARALYRQSQWKKGKFENAFSKEISQDFRPSEGSTEQRSSLLSSTYKGRNGNQSFRVAEDMSPSRFENNQRAQTRMVYAQPKQKNEMHTNFPASKTDPGSRMSEYKIDDHLSGKSTETDFFYKGQFAREGDYNSRFSENVLTSRFEKNRNNQRGGLYRQPELKEGLLPNPQGPFKQSDMKAFENNSNQSCQSSRSLFKRENAFRQPTNLNTMVDEGLFRGSQNEKKVPEEKLSPQFVKYPRNQNHNQYRQYEQKSGIFHNNQELSQNTRSFGPSRFEKNRSGVTSERIDTSQGQSTWERIQNLASSQAGRNASSQVGKFAHKEGNFQSHLGNRPKPHTQSYGQSNNDGNILETPNVTSGFHQKQFEGRRIMNSKSQELMTLQFEDSQRENIGNMYRYSDLSEGNFQIPPHGRSNQGRKNFDTSQKVYQQESNLDENKVNDGKRSSEKQMNRSGGSLSFQKNTYDSTSLYPLMKTGIVQYPLRLGTSQQNYMKNQTQQNNPFGIHKEDTKRRWDGISKEGKRNNSQKGSYGHTSQN
ncbi:uncharacterized protein LOC143246378 [Tachypleus tridentatus]|uniref:uncharacterized protein LOC143246378 n=1 Tax=Tachypleus tridentatus TaxID=6853 RepID=UPI003FD4AB00